MSKDTPHPSHYDPDKGQSPVHRSTIDPDRQRLTEIQARRLAALSEVDAKAIVGSTIADLKEKFTWQINPELLFFRRICGRVVKRDPVTGVEHPVPGATVHVEDTDCSFLWFFPVEGPWGWFFPISCRREEIATTVTDACGRFCVYVPRWDIDWILRWRQQRLCFPTIFTRPTIRDILDQLRPHLHEPQIVRPRRPEPDPPPFLLQDGGLTLRKAVDMVGPAIAGKLAAIEEMTMLGTNISSQQKLLDAPAFVKRIEPPLPPQLKRRNSGEGLKQLSAQLKLDPKLLDRLDPSRFVGPFFRCHDVFIPEWSVVADVPDITFHVTQDVNGDGTEETIYSEGYFDVRWNAGTIPDVTLEATQIAVAGVSCVPEGIACQEPAIVMAGFMPLKNLPAPNEPYHDETTGYARRPNRPHPSGIQFDPPPNPLAKAPFCDDLHLRGCNHYRGAQFYRLRYSYNGNGMTPFVGLTWQQFRWVGSPGHLEVLNVVPDAAGWYPVLNSTDGWMDPHLLLNFRTGQFADGLYMVEMELGDASKNVILTTPPTGIRVDNAYPNANYTVSWRQVGSSSWNSLASVCPVVERPVGADIEFRVEFQASATHLRSVTLSAGGCGGASPTLTSAIPASWEALTSSGNTYGMRHWHTDPDTDNSIARTAFFQLPRTAPQGVYGFDLSVYGRSFNPAGGDDGDENNWNYDPAYYRWRHAPLQFAVVNS